MTKMHSYDEQATPISQSSKQDTAILNYLCRHKSMRCNFHNVTSRSKGPVRYGNFNINAFIKKSVKFKNTKNFSKYNKNT